MYILGKNYVAATRASAEGQGTELGVPEEQVERQFGWNAESQGKEWLWYVYVYYPQANTSVVVVVREQRFFFFSLPSHSSDLASVFAFTGTGSTGGSTNTATLCLHEASQAFRIFINWTWAEGIWDNCSGKMHQGWGTPAGMEVGSGEFSRALDPGKRRPMQPQASYLMPPWLSLVTRKSGRGISNFPSCEAHSASLTMSLVHWQNVTSSRGELGWVLCPKWLSALRDRDQSSHPGFIFNQLLVKPLYTFEPRFPYLSKLHLYYKVVRRFQYNNECKEPDLGTL